MTREETLRFITSADESGRETLFALARSLREKYYGKDVYFRGLIEFSNYCKNDCFYCGLRRSNSRLRRYRLDKEAILQCCRAGAALGYKTFVLQSGEDAYYTDAMIAGIVAAVKKAHPDCAITLSLGEKRADAYRAWFDAGAERYLLRHETASDAHYARLHPPEQTLETRKQCLRILKETGYAVGAGFMTGSPFQSPEDLACDIEFLEELKPDMIGIGPFIPQRDTPFASYPAGSLELTLRMLALARAAVPDALIPATTALGTIAGDGREQGLRAGANVLMPNLSPRGVRKLYALYDGKICTGDEAAECRACIERRVRAAGFNPVFSRGDKAKSLYRKDERRGDGL